MGEPSGFFIVSSLMTLAMILLHTAWGVIFFDSMDTKTYWQTGYVVVTHLLVSCLSLLNHAGVGGSLYPASLPTYLVLTITAVIAVRLAGGSLAGLRKAVACSPASTLQVPAEG